MLIAAASGPDVCPIYHVSTGCPPAVVLFPACQLVPVVLFLQNNLLLAVEPIKISAFAVVCVTVRGEPVFVPFPTTTGPDAAAISIRPSLDVQVQNRMKVGAITAPSATLDVGGTFSVNGTSTLGGMVTIQRGQDANVTNLSINSGTSNTNAFQYNTDQPNSNVILNARNNYNMVLAANDAEKVRLTTTVFSVTPTVLTSVGSISATAASTISAPVRIGSSTARSASLDVDGTFSVSGTSTLGTILVMPEASTLTAGTTTGLKIGGATSQKLGFFNATPVVRQGATTDLGTTLSNLGFRASGSAYPITTSGTVALTGLVSSNTMDLGYVAKTANYTITTSDYLIDCTSGTFTVTLPTASSATAGKLFVVKNSGAGVITVQGNGAELIDAANTKALAVQYSLVAVMSTGTKWIIIYQI